jgi:septal ring factor EnvC (AmiA/AmiB activator)
MRLGASALVVALGLFVGSSSAQLPTGAAPAGAVLATPSDPLQRFDNVGRREKELKQELERATGRARSARVRAISEGRVYVRMARAGLLPIGGGFDALVDHAARLERLRASLARAIRTELQEDRRATELGKELAKVTAELTNLKAHADTLQATRDALLSERDRELAFQRAFTESTSAPYTTVYGASGPLDPSQVTRGFSGMKGRLPFPLPGRTEIHSARLPSSEGPGLEMRAPRETPVRSVFPGRVAFADSFGDYGRAVIVDHGDGYYTVSANLAEVDVRVGDSVSTGTRLGSVGQHRNGWLLYFEIRLGTQTLDPAEWFGI